MKRATWTVLLLMMVIAGAAVRSAAGSASATTRPVTAAVVKTPTTGLSGRSDKALVKGGGPIIVRYVPHARFGIGVVLANKPRQTITLERVRAVVPDLLPLLQVGTRITRHGLPSCSPHTSCPPFALVTPPFRAERTVPRPLRPGQKRVVQLNFRFRACSARNVATAQVRRLLVTYRTRAGLRVHEELALGDSKIDVIGVSKKTRCHMRP